MHKILAIVLCGIIFPLGVFAEIGNETNCSHVGYSIFTINGVFTNKDEAILNRDSLKRQMPPTFNSQTLTVDYLHNPSHLGGLGDLAMSVYQKVFDKGTVEDYDLIEMLKTASEKVKTQKLLLVAHSQGNFYANNFYDTVAGKNGGVPSESIGVYSVATPAGRVAGGGNWITSDTDKVIAGIVKRAPFKEIMSPNTSIALKDGDDSLGHNFKDIYLKYRSKEIISGIRESLDKLKENEIQDSQKNCIDPPKLTLAHKVAGVFLNSADLAINTGVDTAIIVKKEVYNAGVAVVNTAKEVVGGVADLVKTPLSLFEIKKNDIVGNPASVILATNIPKTVVKINNADIAGNSNGNDQEKIIFIQKKLDDIKNEVVVLTANKLKLQPPSRQPLDGGLEEKKSNVPIVPIIGNGPRLLFVGMVYPGFGGGGDALQIQTIASEPIEENSVLEITDLSAPVLSVPQCGYSLAVDGCLLATTTINFSWRAVSGADYYGVNKNGEYATTSDLFFSAIVPDFSDYDFSVSAISSATTSATTTFQTISVATIPIAINEIAWMGTQASSYDEWLELKNNTGHRINLSQWAIDSADSIPYITLSGEMSPHEYRILERRENTITARAVVSTYGNGSSQWALSNNGEELFLSYSSTTIDKTPAISGDSWIAGANTSSTSRKTMERIDSKQSGATTTNWTTWGTNVDFIKNGKDTNKSVILGTPGECNSASFIKMNDGQNITGSTTLEADNCYYAYSQSRGLSVSASSTLTVEEGVRISLYQNNLLVNGVIFANGTEDNPVVIDSFSGSPANYYIKISGNNGTSTMNNVIVSNINQIYLINSASLEVSNASFENNFYGIAAYGGSSVVVENSSFASTTREALSAYTGSSIFVASSTISNTLDADAIGVYNSNLSMSSTTIDKVYDGDGIGLYDSSAVISSSTINNILDGDGVYAYQSTVEIASSTISNIFDGDGLGLYYSTTTMSDVVVENVSDDGIVVYDGSISGNATVEGSEVEF